MAGLAVEPDAAALALDDGVVVVPGLVVVEAEETNLAVVEDVKGEPVLVDAADAVGRARTAGRAAGREVRDVEAEEDEASSFAEETAAESSMLTGVAEREPVGVGLAWIA